MRLPLFSILNTVPSVPSGAAGARGAMLDAMRRVRTGSAVMAFVTIALGVVAITGNWDGLVDWVFTRLGYVEAFVATRIGGFLLLLFGVFFIVDAVWGVRRLGGASSPEDYESVIRDKDAENRAAER